MGIFSDAWAFIRKLLTRPGLDRFLKAYHEIAKQTLLDLAQVNSGKAFHEWKAQAWARLKEQTGQYRDNWIEILISIVFEELKAKGKI
jgi:hypothetical protein